MNKRAIIILIIVAVLLIVGGIWFFSRGPAGDGSGGFFSGLFPLGGDDSGGTGVPPPDGGNLPSSGGENVLTQLTKNAVAGAGAASTTIRYVEKSTGHVYEIEPNGQNKKRVSNATILKTFESLWSPLADKLVMRYFEDTGESILSVKNFSANLFPSGTNSTSSAPASSPVQGMFFPGGAYPMTISPFEDKVFYLVFSNGIANGIISDFEGKEQKIVLKIPFGDFLVSWPSKEIIALYPKPSFFADGYLYFLDIKTGALSRILGGAKGLTALVSSDGTKVLYSASRSKGFDTKFFNISEKTGRPFDLLALPEKCVWSGKDGNIIYCAVPSVYPQVNYPDDWYQGTIFFSDSIWRVNNETRETIILNDKMDNDVVSPFLTKDENYFIFTDKKDGTLWSLKLQ